MNTQRQTRILVAQPSIMGQRNNQASRYINFLCWTRTIGSAIVQPNAQTLSYTANNNKLNINVDNIVMDVNSALCSLTRRVVDFYAYNPIFPLAVIPIATGILSYKHTLHFPTPLIVHHIPFTPLSQPYPLLWYSSLGRSLWMQPSPDVIISFLTITNYLRPWRPNHLTITGATVCLLLHQPLHVVIPCKPRQDLNSQATEWKPVLTLSLQQWQSTMREETHYF